MLKQFIVRITIVLAILSALVFSCAAADGQSGGFTYTVLEDGTASITECSLTGDVVIPAQIGGYTVTNLAAQLFYGYSSITSVSVPATVTYFGENPDSNMWDYVFSYCYDLEKITVDPGNPSFCSVDGVLYNKEKTILINYPVARKGTTFHVPESVKDLCCTSFAASSTRNLRKLYLDGKYTWWYTFTFYDCGNLTVYYLPGGWSEEKARSETENGRSHESDSTRPTFQVYTGNGGELKLPSHLKTIGRGAFEGGDFETVVIPDGCTAVESRAFANCGNLHYVYLSRSTQLADDAFEGCGDITFLYTD